MAHIRTLDTLEQGIDPRIEAMDFSKYDLLLLGGDLTEESSEEEKTLQYLDGIFDLGAPTTLWALGNHDNAQNALVSKYTERPITYTANHDGITFVVLYTQEEQDWICTISGEQLEMLQSVTDTISESSHLIVMTHKLVWIMDNPEMVQHQGNSRYDWSCNYRIHRNNWNTDILPRLREVQERGVQVICLAGDVGNNVRTFEEHTSDGIVYLASGIPVEEKFKAESRMLEFKHWPGEDSLTWVFVPVL
ncbi:MAG: hypothetical protein GYB31_05360 [Bacteroidetes bacterium]|nr:hypothetical protein [Bacteroidota bacterium]